MSIFFYKRLLGTDAINSLSFFKDVFFSLIEKGPGNKDIHLLSSKLNVKNATPTFLELGPAWAKEISHQTLDTELSDLARPIAGGLPAGLAEDEELVLGDAVPGTSTESTRWSDFLLSIESRDTAAEGGLGAGAGEHVAAVADKQRRKKSVLYRRCECASCRSWSRPVSDV